MKPIETEVCEAISELRRKAPLIHNITNYVTVNDCANAVLAIGASPIMADDIGEAADIAAVSSALVLNIGTLNRRIVESMLAAGKKANECGVPVVLDPVGAGASALRNQAVQSILKQVRISILRGNSSELSYVAGMQASTKGVDASGSDAGKDAASIAEAVAGRFGCIAAVTGAVDAISDGKRLVRVHNGHPMLSRVTGTGCMTSALVGSFAAVCSPFCAAVAGIASMGVAGELAFEKAGADGTGSFHAAVLDALSRLDAPLLKKRMRLHEI